MTNFKKEDFEMRDEMEVLCIDGINDSGEYLFHDVKKDIYHNTLLRRKHNFVDIVFENVLTRYKKDKIQIPSNIPVNMIENRIMLIKKIPYTNIELKKIMNRLETKVEIKDRENNIIDSIRFNIKDDYYERILEMINNIDLSNFLGNAHE